MARVQFDVTRRFDVDPRVVWDDLIDWPSHGAWIPLTTIDEAEPGADPTAVGYTFTGWTGFRPVALEDRMRVTRCEWIDETQTGVCTVDKIGPVLGGGAGFTISPDGSGSVLVWNEDVTVPYLPKFLSPVVAWFGGIGFKLALGRFQKTLTRSAS